MTFWVKPQKALGILQPGARALLNPERAARSADTLNNIGAIYYNLSEPQKALDYYNQALMIKKELGDFPPR